MWLALPSVKFNFNFLNQIATSQWSSFPIILTRLGGPRSRPDPHSKLWKCRESNPQPHDCIYWDIKITAFDVFLIDRQSLWILIATHDIWKWENKMNGNVVNDCLGVSQQHLSVNKAVVVVDMENQVWCWAWICNTLFYPKHNYFVSLYILFTSICLPTTFT